MEIKLQALKAADRKKLTLKRLKEFVVYRWLLKSDGLTYINGLTQKLFGNKGVIVPVSDSTSSGAAGPKTRKRAKAASSSATVADLFA